jgi:hypothetical protein
MCCPDATSERTKRGKPRRIDAEGRARARSAEPRSTPRDASGLNKDGDLFTHPGLERLHRGVWSKFSVTVARLEQSESREQLCGSSPDFAPLNPRYGSRRIRWPHTAGDLRTTLTFDHRDVGDTAGWYADIKREPIGAQSTRGQLAFQQTARMGGCDHFHECVTTGLDPVVHAAFQPEEFAAKALTCQHAAWIRGSSPRMTKASVVAKRGEARRMG